VRLIQLHPEFAAAMDNPCLGYPSREILVVGFDGSSGPGGIEITRELVLNRHAHAHLERFGIDMLDHERSSSVAGDHTISTEGRISEGAG
jgi:hypothetical protein